MHGGRVRSHQIPHAWVTKRCKNPSKRKCAVCLNTLGFLLQYEKCKSCKISVHIECKKNARMQDNCGLTQKHLKEIVTQMVISKTQENWAPEIGNSRSLSNIFATNDTTNNNNHDDQLQPQNKEKFDRKSWNMFTIRGVAAWKDDTIPNDEMKVLSAIGRGRFGEVYEAYYYEPAVIKFFDMYHIDEQKRLEAFKQDTACFQNVRHENLVFFRGFYTIDKVKMGIVMEYIRGRSLYKILHESNSEKQSLDFNQIVEYSKQICQGLSYLHTRRILHKDLRSKNIFISDRNAIKITDFGIFNMRRLSYPKRNHSFLVPSHWLRYIAPELLRQLSINFDSLTFTEATDIYAFGTIWYELLTNSFPFASLPSDSILWQVGMGMKAPLTDLQTCHEAKVLFMYSWSFNPADRKSFSELLQLLKTMPRKAIKRSPSFPICKSFESIF